MGLAVGEDFVVISTSGKLIVFDESDVREALCRVHSDEV